MRGTKGKQHVQSLASWWTLDASMKDTDLEYMVWLAPEIRQRSSSLFFFILLHCCQLAGRLKRSSSPWLQQTFWNTLTNNDHLSMIFGFVCVVTECEHFDMRREPPVRYPYIQYHHSRIARQLSAHVTVEFLCQKTTWPYITGILAAYITIRASTQSIFTV